MGSNVRRSKIDVDLLIFCLPAWYGTAVLLSPLPGRSMMAGQAAENMFVVVSEIGRAENGSRKMGLRSAEIACTVLGEYRPCLRNGCAAGFGSNTVGREGALLPLSAIRAKAFRDGFPGDGAE